MRFHLLLLLFSFLLLGCTKSNYLPSIDKERISLIFNHKAISNEEILLKDITNTLFNSRFNINHEPSIYKNTWVYELESRIQWPDKIEVTIQEHKPLAKIKDKGFLTQSGHVISPEKTGINLDLIILEADQKDLLKLFNDSRLLQHQLNRFDEYLVKVKTQQGYTEASTQSGLKIVFDQKDFREQLKRLEDLISFELLSGSLHDIKTIDMRYKNGVAIAFGNKEKV